MPQKNTIKEYSSDSYYHVFSRGWNKQHIFVDPDDYQFFINLFDRYLSGKPGSRSSGEPYPDYSKDVKLHTFCLMPNHVHLLIYQNENPEALRKFMSSLMTSYSKYFNKKYKRVGALFESRYKAKRIDSDEYLAHIGRYIHMNPRSWRRYEFSSLKFAFADQPPVWLAINESLQEFKNRKDYLSYLQDYQENKDQLKQIKHQLADK